MDTAELKALLADLREEQAALALLVGSLERYLAAKTEPPRYRPARGARQISLKLPGNGIKPTEPKGTVSIRNAIVEVLREAGRPMHSREIWELAYQRGARTSAKRPEAIAALNAYGIPGVRKVGPRLFEWVGEDTSQDQP